MSETTTTAPAPFRLRFLGATSTVTGSRFLLQAGSARVLVDCGLFQGYKPLRLRNWAPFPVDPRSLDAVVLTHAHLDHSGYLPRLVKQGFRGPIFCTGATRALCGILLPDSGRLLEEEAGHANRVGSSRHHPAEPLYSEKDALACLRQFHVADDTLEVVPGLRASFRLQSHILGAVAVTFEFQRTRIVFSGDLGRRDDPVMLPPQAREDADWVVCESTYGNRLHPQTELGTQLAGAMAPVLARGGVVVIPAFAVGRAQLLLHEITRLQAEGELPPVPLYLNSPMASEVCGLYHRFPELHRLSASELQRMEQHTRVVRSVEESKDLNRRKGPMIIISASGMATGGRVLHHLAAFAPDRRNAIVLCGFQAGGTRGAALARGAKTVRIFGEDVPVRAQVVQLDAASAHADADGLLDWLRSAARAPRGVFVVHGEPDAADGLRTRIARELGWPAQVPEFGAEVDLLATASHLTGVNAGIGHPATLVPQVSEAAT
jgi:metallo-beta-lactamase family protein